MAIKKGRSATAVEDEHDDELDDDDDEQEEDEEQDDQDDEDESGDDGDDDDGDDDATAQLVSRIVEQVSAATNSVVDSRINSLVKTLTRDYGLQKQKKSDDDDKPDQKATRDPGLTRVLRGAVRDLVSTEFDTGERKSALVIAKRLADARGLDEDEDEDEIAEEIVESVKGFLSDAKDRYETAYRKELEKRGLIDPEAAKQSRKKGGKQKPGTSVTEQFEAGRKRGQERFGQDKE